MNSRSLQFESGWPCTTTAFFLTTLVASAPAALSLALPADYVQRFAKPEDLQGRAAGEGDKEMSSSSGGDSDGFLSSSDEDEPAGKADL